MRRSRAVPKKTKKKKTVGGLLPPNTSRPNTSRSRPPPKTLPKTPQPNTSRPSPPQPNAPQPNRPNASRPNRPNISPQTTLQSASSPDVPKNESKKKLTLANTSSNAPLSNEVLLSKLLDNTIKIEEFITLFTQILERAQELMDANKNINKPSNASNLNHHLIDQAKKNIKLAEDIMALIKEIKTSFREYGNDSNGEFSMATFIVYVINNPGVFTDEMEKFFMKLNALISDNYNLFMQNKKTTTDIEARKKTELYIVNKIIVAMLEMCKNIACKSDNNIFITHATNFIKNMNNK
jgi:hypothetical protein